MEVKIFRLRKPVIDDRKMGGFLTITCAGVVKIAGGALLSLRRRHIHTIYKLLIESAIVGFLLGLAYPFFDRLVNGPLLNGWAMLLSAPVGVCCALVCALTFSDRFVPERSSRADP
ncbi:MAG TPA: hypothetical protein VNO32_23845 [Candidatus Acidoferrum sp.]|nr:hypothetical protein [Candidatus Acidoferrum sp.]